MSLSVVILSYNVKDLLRNALKSVYQTYKENTLQVIVVDNASTDASSTMVKKEFPQVHLIESRVNNGFAKGNNMARRILRGNTVLFLNPDTEVKKNTIKKCMDLLNSDGTIGAVGCKLVMPSGQIDYSCHRGLPTPWNSFCYLSGLSKIFPNSKFFSGYTLSYLNVNESHFVDCITGAFLLVKKKLLDEIGWWDEDYWWNGEDIELCYQIKKKGYKIWYEASVETLHFKGSSSGLLKNGDSIVNKDIRLKTAKSSTRVMRIFTDKHWKELGPRPIMILVRFGIFLLEKYRLLMVDMGLSYK